MFGCVGKIVVLAVLIVLGAAAYLTRGMWEPRVRDMLGAKPAATASAAAPRWEPITVAGAERARRALEAFQRPSGPAFVNVGAGDIVAHALEPVMKFLGPATSSADTSVDAAAALAGENVITVRGAVRLSDLGGLDLGRLGVSMTGTQRISFRGSVTVTEPGKGILRVDRVTIGELMISGPLAGRVMDRVAPRRDTALPAGAVALALPPTIADIRIVPGRVTLYKAVR